MRKLWICGVLAAAACHHAGQGQGTLEKPSGTGTTQASGPVTFMWQSKADASQGAIEATTPTGTQFSGTYLQVTSQATEEDYGPYYGEWVSPGWGAPWYQGPSDGFVTEYSGRVVAHLSAPTGQRMRCQFVLKDPVSGMTGGGEGDCQLSDNSTVFDARLSPGH
jgi:hypothetical protein